ncbi:MAG: NAD(P)H-dependent oxidoreductase [Roseiarcus sp.]|uniref:NAD(P)H-dependent oxidoreductase n=1 Tax=Roseiarcus sp. TaxID=1969460 RepID=UPI003BB1126C
MRVLVVYAHPLETSYLSAVHARVVETLRARGREVDDLDLYKEEFDPVLSPEQMRNYVDVRKNACEVRAYVDRLRAADALVLVFPVWFDGLPAIMQGYFQRVFLPGVATIIDENGLFHRNLANLKRLAAVCAYGEIRADVAKKRDPPRRFVRGNIGALIEPSGQFEYLAIYGMDFSTAPRRAAFLRRVTRAFNAW